MSLIKNSAIIIIGVIVSNLLAYIFHFIAGRMLGPTEYGIFGALMALFLMVALPASALSFAITKYTSRFYSENSLEKVTSLRKKIQKDVLIFSAGMLLIVVLFSQLIANFLKIDSPGSVIIVGVTLSFALLLPVNNGVVLGLKKYKIVSWNTIIEASSRLLLLLLFLNLGLKANGAILAYGLAYFIAFICVFPFIKEIRSSKQVAADLTIKKIYKFILQVLIVNIILQSLMNVPSLIIKHFYSSEFTGYWTASLNIARISLFITAAVTLVMFPEISGEKDHQVKKNIFYRATILALVASTVIAAILFLAPKVILRTLYGAAYVGAASLLPWMGLAMIFIGWLNLWANYELARLK